MPIKSPKKLKKSSTKTTKKTVSTTRSSRRVSASKPQRRVIKRESITQKNPWFWMQSYTSLLLGVVVVIIGILFIATFAKVHHTQETSSISTVATPTPTASAPATTQTYVVQPGDDLWHISEKFYNTGYNYVLIIKANNLANPSVINAGNKLIIPSVSPTPASSFGQENAQMQNPTPAVTQTDAIKTDTYTVQKGDDLWNIAVRAYGDGYRWTDIAKANNLSNPDTIFSGNILQIPR